MNTKTIVPYVLASTMTFLSVAGCDNILFRKETVVETSGKLYLEGKVVEKRHIPAHSDSIPVTTTIYVDDIPIIITNTNIVNYPEQYLTIFQGKARFELDDKNIFDNYALGNRACVGYQDYYDVVYADKDNDGKKEIIKKTFKSRSVFEIKSSEYITNCKE